jgi:hypothetical protein
MKVALGLAHSYFSKTFTPEKEARYRGEQEERARRLKTEPAYQATPFSSPVLAGDSYGRDVAGMASAESRLREIGFTLKQNGNVRLWVYSLPSFAVYAGISSAHGIHFRAYAEPLPGLTGTPLPVMSFDFPENWKHNLHAKFLAKLTSLPA